MSNVLHLVGNSFARALSDFLFPCNILFFFFLSTPV